MATIDQQFVEYIVKTLVNNPDKVTVDRRIDEKGVLLSLTVDPEDIGRVIGRRGVTAQAIRVLLRALGTKQDARYNLKIENSEGENRANSHRDDRDNEAEAEAESEVPMEEANAEIVEDDEGELAVEEDADDVLNEEETESSELAEKTRQELADLDDLDI